MTLPATFAILKEESLDGLLRYAVLRAVCSQNHFTTSFFVYGLETPSSCLLKIRDRSVSHTIRTVYIVGENQRAEAYRAWHLPWEVQMAGETEWIPVMDFEKHYPFQARTQFKAETDTFEQLFGRLRTQRMVRERALAPAPSIATPMRSWWSSLVSPRAETPLSPAPQPSAPPAEPPMRRSFGPPAGRPRRPTPIPALDGLDDEMPGLLNDATGIVQPPASRTAQTSRTIPKRVVDLLVADAVSKQESCPISLEDFTQGMRISVTSCYHLFQEDALKTWMRSKSSCPLCKESIAFVVPAGKN